MTDKLLFEKKDHIVTLTINDPDTRNAISDNEIIDAIVDAVKRVNEDYDARCVILTGAGKAFSSGGNVKNMQNRSSMFGGASGYEVRMGYLRGIQRIPMAMYELEVPSIAAVNGSSSHPSRTAPCPRSNHAKLWVRCAAGSRSTVTSAAHESRNESASAAMAAPEASLRSPRGAKAPIPDASSGRAGMSQRN